MRAHPHPVAARAGRGAGRRLDLGGDDLDGPDAVAHLAADEPEDLAAFLRALAGVADDFDDVLVDRAHALVLPLGDMLLVGRCHGVAVADSRVRLGPDLLDLAAEFFDRRPARLACRLDILCTQGTPEIVAEGAAKRPRHGELDPPGLVSLEQIPGIARNVGICHGFTRCTCC